MELLTNLYILVDSVLMPFYRFPDNPLIGYYLGTLLLSFASIVIGDYSIALAFRINRNIIKSDNNRLIHYQSLSLDALKAGDKASFKACNSMANEAYGKSFFNQITLSAASLWPAFIALGWMQYRFSDVQFHLPFSIPLFGETFGFFMTFIFCYIIMRIAINKIRSSKLFLYTAALKENNSVKSS